MKVWFLFLLLLSFQTSVSCKRRRCPTGLKMNHKGRCIKGWSASSSSEGYTDPLAKLVLHLKNVLDTDVLIPCDWFHIPRYCEVCFKNDPGKIFCPRNEWRNDWEDIAEIRNKSVYEDFSDWKCMAHYAQHEGEAFSYWSGYDDGSICDCGSPFIFHQATPGLTSFLPLIPGEKKGGVSEGSPFIDEDTGVMYRGNWLGNVTMNNGKVVRLVRMTHPHQGYGTAGLLQLLPSPAANTLTYPPSSSSAFSGENIFLAWNNGYLLSAVFWRTPT